jgi:hypothetical protein
MRANVITLFICILGSLGLCSQSLSVVSKVNFWYDSEKNSKNSLQNSQSSDSLILLNFHRVDVYNEEVTPLKSAFDISRSSRLTVIVVFHSRDTMSEHGIWSVVRDGKQVTGLTDKRLLRPNSEYVYPVKRRGIPLINTSVQAFSKIKGKADSNHFVLGEAFLPDLTLSSFSGDIAECLVFDRFLKKPEALKIETYLAIKYGITLIESDYVSSSDVILWNYEENKDYSNGIAGLGRDTVYGLNQKQGCSSEENDLLTIGFGNFSPLNKDNNFSLKEGNYLVWGHNDKELTINNLDCETAYPLMERKWLIQSTNAKIKSFSTWVKFQLPEQYRDSINSRICYLAIDRSGIDDFISKNVEYIAQNQIDTNGFVYFENVVWNANGKNVFTFSFGADLEVVATPSCPTISTGSLGIEICGGQSPFDYLLENDSTHQKLVYQGYRNYIFENLAVGNYSLTVTDFHNNKMDKKIEISVLSDTNGCFSDGDLSDGHKSANRKDNLSDENADNYYNVYPNPASGQFKAVANLVEKSPISVRIYTVTGSLLEEWKDEGKKNYSFDGYLQTRGNYIVEIETDFDKKNFKLTIIN